MTNKKRRIISDPPFSIVPFFFLDNPQKPEDDKDHQDGPKAGGGEVPPVTAMGPCRQSANQQDNNNDQKKVLRCHGRSLPCAGQ
jgi:hypothetical protein